MNDDTTGLRLPAPWIDHPDREWAFSVRNLLGEIVNQLDEAALVLTLYEKATAADKGPVQGVHGPKLHNSACRLRFLHAKSFVYSFDAAGQLMRVLAGLPCLPDDAQSCCVRFESTFGELRGLRNTLQHIEDRLRGLGPQCRPLPHPLVVLGVFRDGFFGATTADGAYVELGVSRATLKAACSIIEDLLWSFAWIGPGNQAVSRNRG
jgi:hypothetical protein